MLWGDRSAAPHHGAMQKPIVVDVDGGPDTRAALDWATDEGVRHGLPVVHRPIDDAMAAALVVLPPGSTSDALVRRSTCPVAVVRAEGGEGPVVVGVDGSPGSQAALRWAVEETRLRGGELEAVVAWQRSPIGRSAVREHEAREALADALDRVDTGGVTVVPTVVEGSPAGALVRASRSASVVVVGTRGRGVVAESVLGSVSHEVLHRAWGPVVVVPDPRR